MKTCMRTILVSIFFLGMSCAYGADDCAKAVIPPEPGWDQFLELRGSVTGRLLLTIAGALDEAMGTTSDFPAKTRLVVRSLSEKALELFQISEERQLEMGAVGMTIPDHPTAYTENIVGESHSRVSEKLVLRNLVLLMKGASLNDLTGKISFFRFIHTHPGMGPTDSEFSVADLRVFKRLKAILEISGFPNAGLEAEIVYRDYDSKEIRSKILVFPAAMFLAKGDYSLDETYASAVAELRQLRPTSVLDYLESLVKTW